MSDIITQFLEEQKKRLWMWNSNPDVLSSVIEIRDRFITDFSGDIVECGVFEGLMVTFLAKVFPEHVIWACDSFQGCPYADNMEYDKMLKEGYVERGDSVFFGHYPADESFLFNNLEKFEVENKERVKILKGWFKDTLKSEVCPIEKISLLRVDGDMYSSTMEILVNLYPKVVKGGVVIFDDWVIPMSRHAVLDYFGGLDKIPPIYDSHGCIRTELSSMEVFDKLLQAPFIVKE